MKYVIWGAGNRGHRIFYHIRDHVAAFIDGSEAKKGTIYCDRPVISFEEYKQKYRDCYIIISPQYETGIEEQLRGEGIVKYFLLSDCPGEFQEENSRPLLHDYVLKELLKWESPAVYGITLYSIVVDEWYYTETGKHLPILSQENMNPLMMAKYQKDFPELDFCGIEEGKKKKYDAIFSVLYYDVDFTNLFSEGPSFYSIFDCSDSIYEYYNPEIEQYRNRHKGKRCFIVMTGPSLRMEDLDILKKNGEICLSSNSIWRAFEKTSWRPNYYIATDSAALEEIDLSSISGAVKEVLLGDTRTGFWERENIPDNVHRFHKQHEHSDVRCPKFSMDCSRKVYHGSTVAYICMQFAVYMGFSEVYLLGVDFSYKGNDGMKYTHFYEEKKLISNGYSNQVELAYYKAKEVFAREGVAIYNATRGGLLELFERVDFDSLF